MSGALNQPLQTQGTPIGRLPLFGNVPTQTLPNFPIQAMPFDIGQGYGAARFLTGNTMIPLNFNIPAQQFTPFQFQPGQFQKVTSSGNAVMDMAGRALVNQALASRE